MTEILIKCLLDDETYSVNAIYDDKSIDVKIDGTMTVLEPDEYTIIQGII